MKNFLIVFSICVFMPVIGLAQNDLMKRMKDKAKVRVDQRVDEGMDQAIDKTEEEITKKPKSKEDICQQVEPSSNQNTTKTEVPLKWVTSNRGETVNIDG